MIWKLLRRNISITQLSAYALANLVGLAVLLVSVKFYGDVSSARSGGDDGDGVIGRDYIVLSKPVPFLAVLGGGGAATSFTSDEIAALTEQPWALKVGEFTASGFNVSAEVEFAGYGMSTAMFLESLPDDFVDIPLDDWTFDPSDPRLPVVIPKDYLALYNFGFASSRGMPQLNEALLMQVPIRLILSGNGLRDALPARIVGLSSRLNTIAVPEKFMTWANARYGSETGHKAPSRLIVEVDNAGDPAIAEWLGSHGMETAGDRLVSGRGAYVARLATVVVGCVGLVISALSVMILFLSIFLLVRKNGDKIRLLLLLGYAPRRVARYYNIIIVSIDLAVAVGAAAIMLAVSGQWRQPLQALGADCSSPLTALLVGFAVMSAVTVIGVVSVRRLVGRCFVNKQS